MKIQTTSTNKTFQEYLNEIFAKFRTGDAAERTYYPVLENLFKKMVVNGEQLIDLHLLRSKILKIPKSQFQGNGDSRVEKKDYDLKTNRVYLNKTQYFDKVDSKVWEYVVGGYRVLNQWLKYRKGKILSTDEQFHFRKIITALRETIEVQKRIDKLYLKVERSLVLPTNKK